MFFLMSDISFLRSLFFDCWQSRALGVGVEAAETSGCCRFLGPEEELWDLRPRFPVGGVAVAVRRKFRGMERFQLLSGWAPFEHLFR